MIAILVPNQYTKDGDLNIKIFNFAPIMMILVTICTLCYWHTNGKNNIFSDDCKE